MPKTYSLSSVRKTWSGNSFHPFRASVDVSSGDAEPSMVDGYGPTYDEAVRDLRLSLMRMNAFDTDKPRHTDDPCLACEAEGLGPYSRETVASEEGKKYDSDKPRMDLLPFDALVEVAKVMSIGAKKYGDDNWKLVEPRRYRGALLRHFAADAQGEDLDDETGLLHLAAVATNALFLVSKKLQEMKKK